MANEQSNSKESPWIALPPMPRISVSSSGRARLAHRRPISLSLRTDCAAPVPPLNVSSSSPNSELEASEVTATSNGVAVASLVAPSGTLSSSSALPFAPPSPCKDISVGNCSIPHSTSSRNSGLESWEASHTPSEIVLGSSIAIEPRAVAGVGEPIGSSSGISSNEVTSGNSSSSNPISSWNGGLESRDPSPACNSLMLGFSTVSESLAVAVSGEHVSSPLRISSNDVSSTNSSISNPVSSWIDGLESREPYPARNVSDSLAVAANHEPLDSSLGSSSYQDHPTPTTLSLDDNVCSKFVKDARLLEGKGVESDCCAPNFDKRISVLSQSNILEDADNSKGSSAHWKSESCSLEVSPTRERMKLTPLNTTDTSLIVGLNPEEGELEEGQLPGEWSGSEESDEVCNDESVPSRDDNGALAADDEWDSRILEREDRYEQAYYAVHEPQNQLSRVHFVQCSTEGPGKGKGKGNKRKKHKKGEGSKKRSREKSKEKYKEVLKKRKGEGNVVMGAIKSGVERREVASKPGCQTGKSSIDQSQRSSQQMSNSDAKASTVDEVIEDGEILESSQTNNGLLSSLVEAEVGLWTTDDVDDQLVTQMEEEDAVKKKRGPETAERKLKRKIAKRKKRAQKELALGIRRVRSNFISKQPVKVLCTHYMKGRCAKGENCTFSHDAVPLTKQEPCKFLMSHACLKGDDCPYSHDLGAFPCKFFHTRGFCYDGGKCQFSHGVISEEVREKLLKRVEKEKKERISGSSVLEVPMPQFSTPIPLDMDPDPLGWGAPSSSASFDQGMNYVDPGVVYSYHEYHDGSLLADHSSCEVAHSLPPVVVPETDIYDASQVEDENVDLEVEEHRKMLESLRPLVVAPTLSDQNSCDFASSSPPVDETDTETVDAAHVKIKEDFDLQVEECRSMLQTAAGITSAKEAEDSGVVLAGSGLLMQRPAFLLGSRNLERGKPTPSSSSRTSHSGLQTVESLLDAALRL